MLHARVPRLALPLMICWGGSAAHRPPAVSSVFVFVGRSALHTHGARGLDKSEIMGRESERESAFKIIVLSSVLFFVS